MGEKRCSVPPWRTTSLTTRGTLPKWPRSEGASSGGDVIYLSGIDAKADVPGNQAFAFGTTAKGGVSLVDSGSNTILRCNTDNDAAFELELALENSGVLASAYQAGDFVL